jgi:AsmA family protein
MAVSRSRRWLIWISIPVILIGLLVAVFDWDWLLPVVESKVSAALGRKVTLTHFNVGLGRTLTITADDVRVENPPGWEKADPPFVSLHKLTVQVSVMDYIRGGKLVVPLVALDQPKLFLAETAKGDANFRLATQHGSNSGNGSGGASPEIGNLQITDGEARVVAPPLRANFDTKIVTEGQGQDGKIVVDARGTYAAQPISGHFVGGSLLSLRDASHPWPVALTVQNGPTHVALNGTIQDPIAFEGANVQLKFAGPDLSLLEPLVGFPIPKTPAYQIAGKLGLKGFNHILFEDFDGRLGNSDIRGTIEDQPSQTTAGGHVKPVVTLNLRSQQVDLADLSGFIGGTPGRATTANATTQEREAAAKATRRSTLLPDTPISVPRLNWADIHLRYQANRIEGRDIPLDNLAVALDVMDGRITVHPISFGVGKGRLLGNIDLVPIAANSVHARADLRLQRLDVSRIMAATHMFQGAGAVSGVGAIDATGNSLASLLGHGNGEVKMAMAGGNLSAVLIDLTGLEFGNALLSALGIPSQTEVECFVGDLALQRGLLDFRAMEMATKEAITNVSGNLNLTDENIDLSMKTDAKHFSIGSLPTRINVGGTFKNPSIRPGAEVAARAGAAVGLGVVLAPLALLPTVQFGTSEEEDQRCGVLLNQARAGAAGKALPAQRSENSTAR